jgi:hypothetical protein
VYRFCILGFNGRFTAPFDLTIRLKNPSECLNRLFSWAYTMLCLQLRELVIELDTLVVCSSNKYKMHGRRFDQPGFEDNTRCPCNGCRVPDIIAHWRQIKYD